MEQQISKEQIHQLNELMDDFVKQTGTNEEVTQTLLRLIMVPDEQFDILAPGILQSYKQTMNTPNNKLSLIQSLNAAGLKAEDLEASLKDILEEIQKLTISRAKRDFLEEMVITLTNAVIETEGISKRTLNISIELCHENAKIPQYATINDAGADVYAIDDYDLAPGETRIIPLGFKLALPVGYAMLIHPRSGLSARTKMRIANSIGLCDAGYRNEYGLIVENIEPDIKHIDYDFNDDGTINVKSIEHGSMLHITKGERIAQLRLVEVPKASFIRVDSVKDIGEDRGGGFGSTGEK